MSACAGTTVSLSPSPQAPVCDATATALVLWAPRWRADQKDVKDREAAAERGLADFLNHSRCFAQFELSRVDDLEPKTIDAALAARSARFGKALTVEVRELGPVLRLGSPALVEGGTEVVLQLTEYQLPATAPRRSFEIRWRNGGPGVVKGVATLQGDMVSTLAAALQPPR